MFGSGARLNLDSVFDRTPAHVHDLRQRWPTPEAKPVPQREEGAEDSVYLA